jgi:hypothetical protein
MMSEWSARTLNVKHYFRVGEQATYSQNRRRPPQATNMLERMTTKVNSCSLFEKFHSFCSYKTISQTKQ